MNNQGQVRPWTQDYGAEVEEQEPTPSLQRLGVWKTESYELKEGEEAKTFPTDMIRLAKLYSNVMDREEQGALTPTEYDTFSTAMNPSFEDRARMTNAESGYLTEHERLAFVLKTTREGNTNHITESAILKERKTKAEEKAEIIKARETLPMAEVIAYDKHIISATAEKAKQDIKPSLGEMTKEEVMTEAMKSGMTSRQVMAQATI